jgi:predicted patatin/cPLA2 family phospholipase
LRLAANKTIGSRTARAGLVAHSARIVPRIGEIKYHHLFAFVLLALAAGCNSMGSRHPVPENLVSRAEIPGLPGMRTLVRLEHVDPGQFDRLLGDAVARARGITNRPLTLLALSGGGSHGSYGAGLLCGWTDSGTRPEFDVVAGISTGSLLGPYAFLGPAYDHKLKEAYTTITDKDIFKERDPIAILFGADSVADTSPLAKSIEKQMDQGMIDAVAAEYRKGRRFYVGTSDLDAQSLMVWDMGAIAASGRPDARKLFCKVLLASASIPVAFPPVLFQVEADGKQYDEMHGDGGVMTQVFGAIFLERLMKLTGHKGQCYVIRNECTVSEWEPVKPRFLPIAGRTVGTLVKTQGIGDLYRAFLVSQAAGIDFNLASIPESFDMKPKSEFDPEYMTALFDLGYNQARDGTAWMKAPPNYEVLEH